MGFNVEQSAAIFFPADKDLVITAGAGSGKTKVLSERVFHLIDSGLVRPESLLVLTFTNNASYEMKTRILDRFGKNHPLYPQMLSAHVQSFDSFRAYLARTYASELNIPKTFVIMPESVESEKRSHFVEEVVEECYRNSQKKADLIAFLTKFGFKDIEKVQECVLYLSNKLSELSPQERAEYFNSYAAKFFSDPGLKTIYQGHIASLLGELRDVLREAAFLESSDDWIRSALAKGDNDDLPMAFSSPGVWTKDLKDVVLDTRGDASFDFLPDLYQGLCTLLDVDPFRAVTEARRFLEENVEALSRKVQIKDNPEKPEKNHVKVVFKTIKKAAGILSTLGEIGTFEEAKSKARWCEKEENFLLGLAKEVSDRLGAYKRSVNAFSFADIGFLALRLFTDSKLSHCALEIASRFDYIMVDEYQDNNDGQEALLAALTKMRPDGSRAHLFCVGDAKQAIYAFRGSNVDLIRNRAEAYKSSPEADVIPMNKNYRSAKPLLSDINHIFSSYMRLDNGGVDYLDPAERHHYDDGVNLYWQDAGNYGFRRIVSPSAFSLQGKKLCLEQSDATTYEATAILNDIQKKVEEKHQIFDRGLKKLRPCDYGDFAILVRRKKQIPTYERLFSANGVSLNNQLVDDLREISPTILLRSILGLMANRLYGEKRDEAHLFASVARSYAFAYDDTKLHRILTGEGIDSEYTDAEKVHIAISQDPIMAKIDAFVQTHQESTFEEILLDILDEFGIISTLSRLRDVEAYVSKVESLYGMAIAERDLGAGLSDFIAFFDSLDEHGIALKSETVSESQGSVDLMTIHASKGLERKIVYMPVSESGIGKADKRNEPPFMFTLNQGICFPYLGYEIPEDVSPDTPIGGSIETIRTRGMEAAAKDGESQEHVRILYVALTRAENAFYFVGNSTSTGGYVMMEGLPRSIAICPTLVETAKQQGCFASSSYAEIENLNKVLCAFKLPLKEKDIGDAFPLAKKLFKERVLDKLAERRSEAYFQFLLPIYEHYVRLFATKAEDLDFLAKIYAVAFYPKTQTQKNIVDFKSLVSSLDNAEISVPEDEEAPSLPSEAEAWKDVLRTFARGVLDGDLLSFAPFGKFSQEELGTKKGKSDPNAPKKVFIDSLLPVFAKVFDGIPYIAYESFEDAGFADKTVLYDDASFEGRKTVKEPELPKLKVDDTELVFEAVEHRRASKAASDPDAIDPIVLERGTHLHRLLQLSKLDENHLDFIKDEAEKTLVLRCLKLDLLQKAKEGKAFPEYGYYDTDFDTTGSIDLLFFDKEGVCHIVDYKSYDIDDPAYIEQLHTYRRNVARIFKLKENDIHLHLLSIKKAMVKDVA